jgi:2-dehydropantoate 2-reductase
VLVTKADRDEYLRIMVGLHPEGMPSMRQDGLAHRKTEVDLFAGTVIELAQRYGMSVPVNQMLYQKIKDMETNW